MSASGFEIAQIAVGIASAVIAAASAVIIAWQAIQTRHSTRAALEVVKIARAELEQSEHLRDDSLKAHIDAEMPRITVTGRLHAEVTDPREPPRAIVWGATDEHERLTQSEYILPRDALMELRVRATVKVTNDGPRHLQASITRGNGQSARPESLDLSPGESKSLEISRTETIQRWVEMARWAQGEVSIAAPYEVRVFALSYRFPGWVGAVENHEVIMGGTVVEPIAENAAGWRAANLREDSENAQPIAVLAVQPFERLHFRNRPGDDAMGWF